MPAPATHRGAPVFNVALLVKDMKESFGKVAMGLDDAQVPDALGPWMDAGWALPRLEGFTACAQVIKVPKEHGGLRYRVTYTENDVDSESFNDAAYPERIAFGYDLIATDSLSYAIGTQDTHRHFGPVDQVTGAFSYEGGSTRVYTRNENEAGHFTANANFRADFDKNTFLATFDGFVNAERRIIDPTWKVVIQRRDLDALATRRKDHALLLQFNGWPQLGKDDTREASPYPKRLTGEFWHKMHNGYVFGAYGGHIAAKAD